MSPPFRFRVLGPVQASARGSTIRIDRAQRRALLGYLLLHVNTAVTAEQLVDALWGEQPPATAKSQVQTGISAIRRALRDSGAAARRRGPIVSVGGGYRLEAATDELDLTQFESLLEAGRSAGSTDRAAGCLRAALELWQGLPLGGVSAFYAEAARARLREEQLAALELLARVELDLGRHEQLIPELTAAAQANPLREKLTGQLMLALYRAGRQGDALATYRRARRILVDELGIEPGDELRTLHRDILRDDKAIQLAPVPAAPEPAVPEPAVPRSLPHDVTDFTGRADDLGWLDRVFDGPATTAIVSAVAGAGGVGKTALAVHWAHHAADRFPDGQLYLNLRGYGPGKPLPCLEALRRLLRLAGVADTSIPEDEEHASALLRSTLFTRKVLVLLDNAASAEQVRPLLPSGSGNLTVITSRDRLGGLIARDSARRRTLEMLPEADSVELIARIIGRDRAAAEPAAVRRLARACGHLPLALRIAAVNIDDEHGLTVSAYLHRLALGRRLAELAVDGDPDSALRTVFEYSMDRLESVQQQVFRLLGLMPGPDFTTAALASLAGLGEERMAPIVQRLVQVHLVEEHGDGRYALHDLIREYAAEIAAGLAAADREAALRRLLSWQLHHVEAANAILYPRVLTLPRQATVAFSGAQPAMRWLDAERHNLLAGVQHAMRLNDPAMSWLLVCAMRPYLNSVRASARLRELALAVEPAARRAGDPAAAACLHLAIGDSHVRSGRYDLALPPAQRCHELADRAGWVDGRVAGLNLSGVAHAFLGRLPLAAVDLTAALELLDASAPAGNHSRAPTLSRLGMVHGLMGQLHAAIGHLKRAIDETRRDRGGALALSTPLSFLAVNYRLQGSHTLAQQAIDESLRLVRGLESTHIEAILQVQQVKLLRDTGDLAGALEQIRDAVRVLEPSNDATAKVHARLTLGTVLAELGRTGEAVTQLRSALTLARAVDNNHNQAEALIALAATQVGDGEHDQALRLAREALEISDAKGFQLLHGQAAAVLAEVYRRQGETALAAGMAQRADELYGRTGHRPAPSPVTWLSALTWP